MQGASVHHGLLRSGGVARRTDQLILVSGSCWTSPEQEQLASPEEILERWGPASRAGKPVLGGTYAIARCDEQLGELTLESDRFGGYPLYFRDCGDHFAAASEMKFLLRPGSDAVDEDALAELMSLGYLSGSRTLIKGISQVRANQRLTVGADGWKVESCPTPGYPRNRPLDDDAIVEYDAIIQRYLARFKRATSRFSLSLSGGLDSRLIAMAALRSELPVEAFTIGESGSLDARMANELAGRLGIPIKPYEVRGEGMAGWFHRLVWLSEGRVLPNHMHYMAAHFSRAVPPGPQLHGMIGETHLGGPFDNVELLDGPPEAIRRVSLEYGKAMVYWPAASAARVMQSSLHDLWVDARDRAQGLILSDMGFKGDYRDMLEFKLRYRVLGFTIPCLNSQVLPWTDLAAPFLDSDAFDFGATLKAEDVEDRRGQIAWGLKMMPGFADLPRIKDGVMIPVRDDDPAAFSRGIRKLERQIKWTHYVCRLSRGRVNPPFKRSFPVYGQWYRKYPPVRRYVDDVLLSEQCLDRGLFRREGVKELLHKLRVGHNVWNAVGNLLLTEIFYRQFLDGAEIPDDPVTPFGMER